MCWKGHLRSSAFRAVVALVKALIVKVSINRDPVGLVNATAILRRRTLRKSTSYLDPSPLTSCDCSNLIGNFREILILAHDKCHIVRATMSKPNYINRDPDINTFLLPG